MFKKLLIVLISLVLVPISSFATDITVINHSNKASPATVFGLAYKNAVNGQWYQAADCQDANRIFNTTPNSVMIYNSSIEFAARTKNLDCRLADAGYRSVVYIGESYMSICRLPGTTHDLGPVLNTMGIASMYATKRNELNFREVGAEIKLIPYGGSKQVIFALRAGDITLGWIGSSLADKLGDQLRCLYSTDPSQANFLGNKFKLPIPDFRIITVIYTNVSDKNILATLLEVQHNGQFRDFLTKSRISSKWGPSDKDVQSVISYVDRLQQTFE
jgi:hypothetical protein